MDLFFFCYSEPLRHTYLSKSFDLHRNTIMCCNLGMFHSQDVKERGPLSARPPSSLSPIPSIPHRYNLQIRVPTLRPSNSWFTRLFLLLIVTWTRHSLWHFDHLHYSWSSIPNKYWFIPYHTAIIRCTSYQWIGLREQNTGTPYILIGKTMVSGEDVPFNRSIDPRVVLGFSYGGAAL